MVDILAVVQVAVAANVQCVLDHVEQLFLEHISVETVDKVLDMWLLHLQMDHFQHIQIVELVAMVVSVALMVLTVLRVTQPLTQRLVLPLVERSDLLEVLGP